jgi:hypothetical protein
MRTIRFADWIRDTEERRRRAGGIRRWFVRQDRKARPLEPESPRLPREHSTGEDVSEPGREEP